MKSNLIIDFNNLLYKNIFTHQELTFAGQFTGGLFGFAISLAKLLTTYPKSNVIVCKDNPPYLRSKLYKEYKGDRKKDPSFFSMVTTSTNQVEEFLSYLGIQPMGERGLEADDVIASIVPKLEGKKIIASSDSDLYQLLHYDDVILAKKTGVEYTRVDFAKEFSPLTPKQWPVMIALMGSHNGVKGFDGVGIKTACKYVLKGADFLFEKLGEAGIDTLERNLDLATIPFKEFRGELTPPKKRAYDERAIITFLSKLGITFSPYMKNAFQQLDE